LLQRVDAFFRDADVAQLTAVLEQKESEMAEQAEAAAQLLQVRAATSLLSAQQQLSRV
jgi:hypothetical protein